MRLAWAAAGLMALAVAACDKVEQAPAVLIETSQVEPMIFGSADLKGRRVSLDGYLNFDNGPYGQAIAMRPQLRTRPNGAGEALIGFDLEHGEGPNQLHLPVLEKEKIPGLPAAPEILTIDVAKATFQDKAGVAHPFRDRVRVTGRLMYSGDRKTGPIGEDDPSSPTGKRFKPQLIDVELEAAPEA